MNNKVYNVNVISVCPVLMACSEKLDRMFALIVIYVMKETIIL